MIYHFHLLLETLRMIDWFILQVEAMYIYQQGKKGKKTITCLGTCGGIFPESQPSRNSLVPFVSHSDLAIIIRWTPALSMQMLSVLSAASLDSSAIRKQSSAPSNAALWHFSFETKEEKRHGGFTDVNNWCCIIWWVKNLISICCKKNFSWRKWNKYLPSYEKQPPDEMPLPFSFFFFFSHINLWNIYLASWHVI